MTPKIEQRMKTLVAFLLVLGIVLGLGSVAICAMVDSGQVEIRLNVAVLDTEMRAIKARVENIENRLFAILLAAGGALCTSIAGSVASLMTHREVKNGRGVKPDTNNSTT